MRVGSWNSVLQLQNRDQNPTSKGHWKPGLWVSGPHFTLPIGQAPLPLPTQFWFPTNGQGLLNSCNKFCSSSLGFSRHLKPSHPPIQWGGSLQELGRAPLSKKFAFSWRSKGMLGCLQVTRESALLLATRTYSGRMALSYKENKLQRVLSKLVLDKRDAL